MIWALTAALSITVVELFVRLPFPGVLAQISTVSRKALHIVSSRSISDHWKEKALLAYYASLFRSTMKLVGLLLVVGMIAILVAYLFVLCGYKFEEFIVRWTGILFYSAVATTYFTLRKVFVRYWL